MAIATVEKARNLDGRRRALWTAISALVAGNGIWATSYISLIAYASGARAWYEVGDALTSAALIYACAGVSSYFLVYHESLAARLIAGFFLGGGVAAMPFIGILGVAGDGKTDWGDLNIFAAAASSIALTIGAVASLQRGLGRPSRVISLALLVTAVGLAHFFAWSAGSPFLTESVVGDSTHGAPHYISKMVGFFGALVFAGIAGGILLDRYHEDRDRRERVLEAMVAKLQLSEQQALAADRAKTAFLTNINHEIRTPLHGVIGMLEILRSSNLDLDQKQQVKIARESAERLHQILQDILSLTNIDRGEIVLEDKPYDLRALI